MHINEIGKILQLMDMESYSIPPCFSPENVESINFQASKIRNLKISYALRDGLLDFEDPDCDPVTEVLFDCIERYVSGWRYYYEDNYEQMPPYLTGISVVKIAKWTVFFIRTLGYAGGGRLMLGINCVPSRELNKGASNKEVFLIFKTAFEEEDPLSKVRLRELLLEFFGWDENIKEECALNHEGLSDEDITYLRKLYEISIQQACSECKANQA
jgi:hypothetical protein